MYRNKKTGRFITKKQHNKIQQKKQDALRGMLAMTLPLLTIGLMLGFAAQPYTIIVQSAQADEYIPMTDICELEVVECEGEEPIVDERVQKAIDAVSNSLGYRVKPETENRIKYLYERSLENNVLFEDAVGTIFCESMWMSQQSNARYDNGLPELSFGLSQIHLPSHPHITKEQAMDAYFAIDFLVEHWHTEQAVNDNMWFGYSRIKRDCTNGLHIDLSV